MKLSPQRVWEALLLLYALVVFGLFFSVSDQPLGRQGMLPLPPTVFAIASVLPFLFLTLFHDISPRNSSWLYAIITANALPLTFFALVAFLSIFLSILPGAYWEESAKWIFLISYGFLITVSAACIPLITPARRAIPAGLFIALCILCGSIIYDVAFPGTFSTIIARAAGFPGNSNFAALVTVMLCASGLDYVGKRRPTIDAAFLIVAGLAVILTASRSGLVNFGVLLSFFFFHRYVKGGIKFRALAKAAITGTVAVVLFATIAPRVFKPIDGQQTRLTRFLSNKQVDDGSAASRMSAVEDSFRLINENPILGHGTGHSRTMIELPHNLYLQQWINNGLFGLVAYVGLLVSAWYTFRQRRYYAGQAFVTAAAVGSFFSHNVLDQRPFLLLMGIHLTTSWLERLSFAQVPYRSPAYAADDSSVAVMGSPATAK